MTNLKQLQQQLQAYLLDLRPEIKHLITKSDTLDIDRRLNIYQAAYRIRLLDVLATNYPIIYAYLGEEGFRQLALAYINTHSSSYKSIRWYGDSFVNFIKQSHCQIYQFDHFDAATNCMIAELAHFEWQLTFHC